MECATSTIHRNLMEHTTHILTQSHALIVVYVGVVRAAAERIGVIAEPETVMRLLQPGMRVVVLASDGVFEFLKNQAVIDLVRPNKP
jgi:serine/threonine protein phosphatase PrpC